MFFLGSIDSQNAYTRKVVSAMYRTTWVLSIVQQATHLIVPSSEDYRPSTTIERITASEFCISILNIFITTSTLTRILISKPHCYFENALHHFASSPLLLCSEHQATGRSSHSIPIPMAPQTTPLQPLVRPLPLSPLQPTPN